MLNQSKLDLLRKQLQEAKAAESAALDEILETTKQTAAGTA
jgi:hypothetical protein